MDWTWPVIYPRYQYCPACIPSPTYLGNWNMTAQNLCCWGQATTASNHDEQHCRIHKMWHEIFTSHYVERYNSNELNLHWEKQAYEVQPYYGLLRPEILMLSTCSSKNTFITAVLHWNSIDHNNQRVQVCPNWAIGHFQTLTHYHSSQDGIDLSVNGVICH